MMTFELSAHHGTYAAGRMLNQFNRGRRSSGSSTSVKYDAVQDADISSRQRLREPSPSKDRSFRTGDQRKISHVLYMGQNLQRFYFEKKEEFDDLFERFHLEQSFQQARYQKSKRKVSFAIPPVKYVSDTQRENEKHVNFQCVGYVNVSMRMCTRCRDSGKPRSRKDKYYVDSFEIGQTRTILCHGCMGEKLNKFKTKMRIKEATQT